MKTVKLFSLIAFILTLTTFTSCDKIKSVADVKFDAEVSADMETTSASETLKGSSYFFEGSATIDPTSDNDINKYYDLIKDWEIKKIVVSVQSIDEPTLLENAELFLVDNDEQQNLYSATLSNVELQEGTKILEVSDADWTEIVNALNAKHKILASLSGSVDKPSINIVFRITIFVKVTANPL